MNSDNYEFSKSSAPQSITNYSAYTDKQWNYVNDINSGCYANNSGLTLVQWDLTSIYNSAGFSDASDLYLAVPIVMCAATGSTTAAGITTAPTAGYGLCSLKSNYQHLIHQIEIVCNGKTCEQMQPFISVVKNFQLLSQMSATDLKCNSISLGLSDVLDNEKSVQWNTIVGASPGGIGLCNNRPFISSTTASTDSQLFQSVNQNGGTVNGALQKRISRIVDTTKPTTGATAGFNKIFGSNTNGAYTPVILSSAQLGNEIKPYYSVNNNIMTWYDVGLIPLKYISDFINNLGLVKKLDLVVRAYFNTGSLQMAIGSTGTPAGAGAAGTDTYYGAVSSSTFANTCPLSVNLLNDTTANGGFYYNATAAQNTSYVAAGLFIAKAPTTSIGTATINLANGNNSHPMIACRCYYSQVRLDPERQLEYIRENREKKIVYEQVLFNQYTAISSAAAFSQLVQSGIKNPVAVVIIPFISTSCGVNNNGTQASGTALGFAQYANPCDMSPSTYSPISLTNLSVTLGGVNVLNTSLNYTYENFLSQIMTAECLTSSDIGIACGLISQSWWEMNRVYYIDLARSRDADKAMPRNLNISFNNNTLIPIDIMVFTIYLDSITIDIETGLVKK